MKEKNAYSLSDIDNKTVQLFAKIGMPKNLAKTLLYVYQTDQCKASDIERGAELRQPEVSVAIQELRERGWVTKQEAKKKGKGRPVHIYRCNTSLSNILDILEQEKLKDIKSVEMGISELKNIINKT